MASLLDMLGGGQGQGLQIDPSLAPAQASTPSGSSTQPKARGKAGENTLNILGTVAGLAGKLFFGPDFDADLGAPFKAGAAMLKQKRDNADIQELLGANPHTAPLLQAGQMIHDSGGLANNTDALLHPDTLNTFKVGHNDPNLLNTIQQIHAAAPQLTGTPDPNQLQASATPPSQLPAPVQQQAQPATGGNSASMYDPTSPEFLQRAATLSPEMARDIAEKRATARPEKVDPIAQILAGLKLRDYESPTQKRDAELKNQMTVKSIDNQNVTTRQNDSRNEKLIDDRSKLADSDRTSLDAIDQALVHIQALPEKLDMYPTTSATSPFLGKAMSVGTAKMSEAFPGVGSLVSPELNRINEGLKAAKIQIASSLKGARVNDKTLSALTDSLPQTITNPELWPQIKQQVIARYTLAKLAKNADLTLAGKTHEGIAAAHGGTPLMDVQQAKDFKDWMTIFEKHGQGALKSATFAQKTKEFGLDNLFINPPKATDSQ